MPFLSGYTKRKQITIDHTVPTATLTDFSFFFKITNDSDVGAVAASNGTNIRFTSSDGTTLLNYGIISFSITSSQATGIFQIKIPSISTSVDTVIYMYYDNSGASDGQNKSGAFDSNVNAYWPLNDTVTGSSGDMKDWKGSYNATSSGGPTSVAGQIGNGLQFDGTNDYVDFNDNCIPTGSNNVTLSFIMKTGDYSAYYVAFDCGTLASPFGRRHLPFVLADTNYKGAGFARRFAVESYGGGIFGNSTLSTNTIYHFAYTWNGSTRILYVNGVDDGVYSNDASSPNFTASGSGKMGAAQDLSGYYPTPLLQHLRIDSVARASTWLLYEYTNKFNNSSTFTLGSQEVGATTLFYGTTFYSIINSVGNIHNSIIKGYR